MKHDITKTILAANRVLFARNTLLESGLAASDGGPIKSLFQSAETIDLLLQTVDATLEKIVLAIESSGTKDAPSPRPIEAPAKAEILGNIVLFIARNDGKEVRIEATSNHRIHLLRKIHTISGLYLKSDINGQVITVVNHGQVIGKLHLNSIEATQFNGYHSNITFRTEVDTTRNSEKHRCYNGIRTLILTLTDDEGVEHVFNAENNSYRDVAFSGMKATPDGFTSKLIDGYLFVSFTAGVSRRIRMHEGFHLALSSRTWTTANYKLTFN
jgi:hypothetical protein